jgi:predicted TIM-barrel fold metal-dependent hydrolase
MDLQFFDCNVSYGTPVRPGGEAGKPRVLRPAPTVEAVQEEMARAGVAKAVVWRVEQMTGSTLTANEMLADDLRGCDQLFGTWALLPSHTHEIPDPEDIPAAMKASRIIGWRLFPERCRFLMKGFALRDWLELAVARSIPLFISTAHGASLEQVAALLAQAPELTVILTYANEWPSDRLLRPFVKEFPNVCLDMTFMLTDGGIESFVGEYGAGRLLYGSGFPGCYFGANMLMIKHADIADVDKVAIAAGNLTRIVDGVRL